MAHSVILTTPMPTWEETVARYGLTKAEEKFVIELVDSKVSRRRSGAVNNRRSVPEKQVKAHVAGNGKIAGKKTKRCRAA